ncbi:MAG TPA: carbon starvation CstA family protein [Planctomycetaceae bacterium]|jgi:carbon starvation protein|nr:carbon starvation CstA family protein [Planctomycetaceae bacterium]
MSLLAVVTLSAVVLLVAYFIYGRVLGRLLQLDPNRRTPAYELRDDLDYSPLEPSALLSQHFSAIAAAGPIVGPILAGVMFGWVPALCWILVGSVFVGGVHDYFTLVASIRHKARSIAEVVRDHMSRRSYLLFLAFVWLALVYIIVAFTDITASSFIGKAELENGQVVTGGGVATSSLLYLVLPIIMGLLMRYTKLKMGLATVIFLPLVGVAIWVGQKIPFDVESLIQSWNPSMTGAQAQIAALKTWDVALLIYCFIASIVPVWLLLQPRGHLGGYFLYAALAAGAAGVLLGGKTVEFPAFRGWTAPNGQTLFPVLFITIACGACSGFHSMIASGTTSKQLRRETDARLIGYGAMLLEAMVAVVALCCVMILPTSSVTDQKANYIYAQGIGQFLQVIHIPATVGVAFAMMAFTTFVYDTLDVCTRLGRFIIQELTGWHDAKGRWISTLLTAAVPVYFLMQTHVDSHGKVIPVWETFWSLFGASNQLLAALSLLGVTVWLWRTRGVRWVWFVTGIPTLFMYVMSTWALVQIIGKDFGSLVATIAIVLLALAALMAVEAVTIFIRGGSPPRSQREPEVELASA